MTDTVQSFLRGMGNGASFGLMDRLSPYLTPEAKDDTGIPRNYAAGSATEDMKRMMKRETASAQQQDPNVFAAGQVFGMAPAIIASLGEAGAAAAPADAALTREVMRPARPAAAPEASLPESATGAWQAKSTVLPPRNPNAVFNSKRTAPQRVPSGPTQAEIDAYLARRESAMADASARKARIAAENEQVLKTPSTPASPRAKAKAAMRKQE